MKKLLFTLLMLLIPSLSYAAVPVILFSDMTDGPVTGWNGSETQGAAVTIWCRNVGTSRGSSYVTVTNGASSMNLTTDGDYLEWGATGDSVYPKVRLGMQRISFFLNSSMVTTGTFPNSTITVTVGGVTSGTLKFHCRVNTHIYFFATDGSNANPGTIASPKQTTDWFRANAVEGDVAYFRAGQWSAGYGGRTAMWAFDSSHNQGSEGKSITATSYPGENVIMGDAIGHGASGTPYFFASYETAVPVNYWTFSKFSIESSAYIFLMGRSSSSAVYGSNNFRIIGNDLTTNYNTTANTGLAFDLMSSPGGPGTNYLYILGNYIHDLSTDYRYQTIMSSGRKYGIYIEGYGTFDYVYLGWNEWGYFGLVGGTGGRAIDIFGHVDTDRADHVYIFNNFAYESGRSLIEVGGGDGVSYYNYMGTAYIYNNIFDASQDPQNANLYDDPVVQLNGAGDTAGRGGTFYVYNNTIVNKLTGGGDTEGLITSYQTNLYIKNNIVETHNSDVVYIRQKYGTWSGSCGPNLYYGHLVAGKPTFDTVSTLDPADPVYLVAPSIPFAYTNYNIQSSSPARDGGTNVGSDIAAVQVAGTNIPEVGTDFLGVSRGSAYDIGAFEYGVAVAQGYTGSFAGQGLQ